MKHSEYVEVIKSYGETALKKVLVRVIVKKLPFLAMGPGNALLLKLCSWIAIESAEEAEMRVLFKFIDFRTDDQAKDFEALMIKNNNIQKIGTEDEKKAVEKELEDALNKLVNLRQ